MLECEQVINTLTVNAVQVQRWHLREAQKLYNIAKVASLGLLSLISPE